jgi:hypothetical protein
MLKEGKLYIVKSKFSGCVWLFKKRNADHITSHVGSICLNDMFINSVEGYSCEDNDMEYLKPANNNYIAIWNRVFNDNVEM